MGGSGGGGSRVWGVWDWGWGSGSGHVWSQEAYNDNNDNDDMYGCPG